MAADTRKLPVFATTRDVYAVTLRHAGELLRFAWPWLIALTGVSAALYWSFYPAEREAIAVGATGSDALWLLTLLASTLIGALIAVPWHRRILLGEPQTFGSGIAIDGRKISYAIKAVLLLAAMTMPGLALFVIIPPPASESEYTLQDALWMAAIIVWFAMVVVLSSRLSLILPATAVGDDDVSVSRSWQMTRRNTLRLALVSFLATMLPFLLLYFVLVLVFPSQAQAAIADAASARMSFTIANVITELVALVLGMLYVTFLSLAYRHFAGAMGSRAVAPDAS